MICPKCKKKLYVMSVFTKDNITYRKLQCKNCNRNFYSIEDFASADEVTIAKSHLAERSRFQKKNKEKINN